MKRKKKEKKYLENMVATDVRRIAPVASLRRLVSLTKKKKGCTLYFRGTMQQALGGTSHPILMIYCSYTRDDYD